MENGFTSQFAIGLRNLSKNSELKVPVNLIKLIEKGLQLGITTYDHADVYGDLSCEAIFGNALKVDPSLRRNIQIISKCGIQTITSKRPENKIKFYDLNAEYILNSVNQSLRNFNTDYIDLYLLHRPDYLVDIYSVAKTLNQLRDSGKVLNFGVSNFSVFQYEKLTSVLNFPLVINQLNISVVNTKHIDDGILDYCELHKIVPMAYQTLIGGKLLTDTTNQFELLRQALSIIGKDIGNFTAEQVAIAWLLKHPSGIVPIIGSLDIDRIVNISNSIQIDLSHQQWYNILKVSNGKDVE